MQPFVQTAASTCNQTRARLRAKPNPPSNVTSNAMDHVDKVGPPLRRRQELADPPLVPRRRPMSTMVLKMRLKPAPRCSLVTPAGIDALLPPVKAPTSAPPTITLDAVLLPALLPETVQLLSTTSSSYFQADARIPPAILSSPPAVVPERTV